MPANRPFTNTHVHIFLGQHIPKYIAKKMVPWPLYYLTNLQFWIKVFCWFKKEKFRKNQLVKIHGVVFGYLKSNWLTLIATSLVMGWLILNAVYYFLSWFDATALFASLVPSVTEPYLDIAQDRLIMKDLLLSGQIGLVLTTTLLSANARVLIWFIIQNIFKPLKYVTGERLKFLRRYLDIIEFAKYKNQSNIFNRLRRMYPDKSKLVVLPMDMEFMAAGKPKVPYLDQLKNLNDLVSQKGSFYRDQLLPFIFVDPRRITAVDGAKYFNYNHDKNGKVVLGDCLLKDYLEPVEEDPTKGNFRGIKIYPALGYYPTDPALLPLWLYCCQNDIPITTHCTVGTMYYRGLIDSSWFEHPVFRNSKFDTLKLATPSNRDLQINFTHPLNYLALLEPTYFYDYLSRLEDAKLDKLFGKTKAGYSVNLKDLKLNIAHFGGSEQWIKYLKEDRNIESLNTLYGLGTGLDFFKAVTKPGENPLSRPAWLWENQNIDWFSVITSLMWQYKNIYADISYILHNEDLLPLLKWTLDEPELKKKILFGTDFYVVRNHKSEKELLNNLSHGLSDEHLYQIANENPYNFLRSAFHE